MEKVGSLLLLPRVGVRIYQTYSTVTAVTIRFFFLNEDFTLNTTIYTDYKKTEKTNNSRQQKNTCLSTFQ
jgi:hypothetical protein